MDGHPSIMDEVPSIFHSNPTDMMNQRIRNCKHLKVDDKLQQHLGFCALENLLNLSSAKSRILNSLKLSPLGSLCLKHNLQNIDKCQENSNFRRISLN